MRRGEEGRGKCIKYQQAWAYIPVGCNAIFASIKRPLWETKQHTDRKPGTGSLSPEHLAFIGWNRPASNWNKGTSVL